MTDAEFLLVCEANSFGAVARGEYVVIPPRMLRALLEAMVAAERERCALIVDRINGWSGTREIAAEIRRGPNVRGKAGDAVLRGDSD